MKGTKIYNLLLINMKRIICFDARGINDNNEVLQLVYSLDYQYILIDSTQMNMIKPQHRTRFMVYMTEYKEFEIERDFIVVSDNINTLDSASRNHKTALYCNIKTNEDMDKVLQNGLKYSFLMMEFLDETNIPLELLIATLQDKETILLKVVKNTQDALIAMKVMEHGSDGVVLSTSRVADIIELDDYIRNSDKRIIKLSAAKVISVEHIEMGDRVCVDTTSIMSKSEGMLVGSTSFGGLFVSSETHYLPYMSTRPFRVNAGAVHSYIFSSDGETRYLSELKSGDRVEIVDIDGNVRTASVGRVKIERRPLIKIVAEVSNRQISVIVQDDWHIRLFGAEKKVMNASNIKKDDILLSYICEGGRHVGIKIKESIIEM